MYEPNRREFTRIYSLGSLCQTAHQIRRYFGYLKRGTFDWWITYSYPLVRYLEDPNWNSLYDSEHLEIKNDKYVWNKEYGIEFHHEFRVDDSDSNSPIMENWQNHIPLYCSRTRYLTKRMLEPGGSILFIRGYKDDPDESSVINALKRAYLNTPWNILFVEPDADQHWDQKLSGYSCLH